jgi:hypothetical protein
MRFDDFSPKLVGRRGFEIALTFQLLEDDFAVSQTVRG